MARRKRANEFFLLATGNQTVIADGATTLVDSDGTTNLASGQLGIFHAGIGGTNTMNTAINSGDTIVESPKIIIAQGTASAADAGLGSNGFYNKPYRKSHEIEGRLTRVWTGQAYVAPRLNAWVIGADGGASDAIGTPLDNTEYKIRVAFNGRRYDEMYSISTVDTVTATYTTPNYTTLGTVNPLDHLIQHLVSNINKNSRLIVTNGRRGTKDLVALAVRFEGGFSGANTTTNVSDMDSLDGATVVGGYGFSTDAETAAANNNSQMGAAFVSMVADTAVDVDTDTQVVALNLTTAGSATSGCNGIIILALDALTAYVDRIPQLKAKLKVALDGGFLSTVTCAESSDISEGEGLPRQLQLLYNDTQGQREYPANQNRVEFPVITPPVTFDTTAIYSVYIIESDNMDVKMISPNVSNPLRTYIVVPNASTTTKTSLESALNSYFTSVNLPAVII